MLKHLTTTFAIGTIFCGLSIGGWLLAVPDDIMPPQSGPAASRESSRAATIARSGAVSRALPEKLDEAISLKDFGATGDGRTDDTIAFQAALDCGAQRSRLPKHSGAFVRVLGAMRFGLGSGWAESRYFSVGSRFADFYVRTCRSVFRFSSDFPLSGQTATQSGFLMFDF